MIVARSVTKRFHSISPRYRDASKLFRVTAPSALIRSNYFTRIYGFLYRAYSWFRKCACNEALVMKRVSDAVPVARTAAGNPRSWLGKRQHQYPSYDTGLSLCENAREMSSLSRSYRSLLIPLSQHRGNKFNVYECSLFATVDHKHFLNFKLHLTWCHFVLGEFWRR